MGARAAISVLALIAAGALASGCSSNSQGQGQSGAGDSTVPTPTPTSTAPTTTPVAPSTASTKAPSSASAIAKPAPSSPVREVHVTSTDGKRSYDVKVWWQVDSEQCADHAYGTPVVQYLTAHPCQSMVRLLATTTVAGKAVGFASSSLGFIGNAPQVYKIAGNFAALEARDGTGSVNDLLREGYRLPSGPSALPSPDAFDVESQDSGVTIVDAFFLTGPTPNNDPALVQMAKDLYLQL